MVHTTNIIDASSSVRATATNGRDLLAASELFDRDFYLARGGADAYPDPLAHYLETGWRLGLEPNSAFPGSSLRPYFASLGLDEPPAITWLVLRSANWPVFNSRAEIELAAASVRNSGLFDEAFYASQLGPESQGLDLATHYVVVGERLGLAPSCTFDPKYYGDRNPDVRHAGMNYLLHYANFGRAEGRLPQPANLGTEGRANYDSAKGNVILVVHETSRTGAPILGWNLARRLSQDYNLFTVRLGNGELTDEYERLSVEVYGPFLGSRYCEVEIEYALRQLLDARKYRYAIVNSIAGHLVVEPCVRHFVPTLLLVHEFASYMGNPMALQNSVDWSAEVVLSAPVVAKALEAVHPNVSARPIHILPQGLTTLPPRTAEPTNDEEASKVLAKLAAKRNMDGTFIVLGCGFVHLRKGVDLFLSAAASVVRHHPRRPVHFLWVGAGYRPKQDTEYSVYLQEQIDRCGLADHVTFLGMVADVVPAYSIADAFFLCSRLDPLPNAAMDALVAGLPVFCFRDSSGIADLMLSDPQTSYGVVDYMDTEAVAKKIIEVADDQRLRQRLSPAMQELARRHFDMDAYVRELDTLGNQAFARMQLRRADALTLANDSAFDQDMFLGPTAHAETRKSTIARYLAMAGARGWKSLPETDHYFRRPAPGFNPRLYAASHPDCLEGCVDPLADFIRRGKPCGPWQLQVIRAADPEPAAPVDSSLRVALHVHLFYTELCPDFRQHLEANQSHCDLFFTTDHPAKAEQIQRSFARYTRGDLVVRIVPNRGRDIGPFLLELVDDLKNYDLIGHLHAKRSKWKDGKPSEETWGEAWREFLWQNLVGGLYPMMDRIAGAFAHDPSLGLVFPSDPNLVGWGQNLPIASALAQKIGWNKDLPEHFDFPLGTMFWIRRAALLPLLQLGLTRSDFPEEPLPFDGTILHALERLSPFACQVAGLRCAVTHVPGLTWAPPRLPRYGW